jgi:hypothetical protein
MEIEASLAPLPEPQPRGSIEAPEPEAAVQAAARSPRWSRARPSARAPSPKWLWPAAAAVVVLGGAAALIWLRIVPLDRLRGLASRSTPETSGPPPVSQPAPVTPDSVMARDTAALMARDTATLIARDTATLPPAAPPAATTPAETAPRQPPPERALPPAPPTLPPGVSLTRPVVVVQGLKIETVVPVSAEGREGFAITQVLRTGQRIVLEEFPSDTAGAGEIAITSLPGDTVVGHVRASGLEVSLKGVLAEDLVVQLLLQLVEVRPPR